MPSDEYEPRLDAGFIWPRISEDAPRDLVPIAVEDESTRRDLRAPAPAHENQCKIGTADDSIAGQVTGAWFIDLARTPLCENSLQIQAVHDAVAVQIAHAAVHDHGRHRVSESRQGFARNPSRAPLDPDARGSGGTHHTLNRLEVRFGYDPDVAVEKDAVVRGVEDAHARIDEEIRVVGSR